MTILPNIGRKGEEIAREYLEKLGYSVLHLNWRAGQKEVDIIAQHKNLLIFVEVKTRSYSAVLEPHKAVNRNKQKMIVAAAQTYITRSGSGLEVRFDVIAIITNARGTEIEHIEDAYRAYAR